MSHNERLFLASYRVFSFFTVATVVATGVTLSFLLRKMTGNDSRFAKGAPSGMANVY